METTSLDDEPSPSSSDGQASKSPDDASNANDTSEGNAPDKILTPLDEVNAGSGGDGVSTGSVSGAGGDSAASSTSGILTDVSSSGMPASSTTLGVSGPDEEGETSEETTAASKTEVEQADIGDEVDDATPTNRHAPALDEGDAVEEASTAAEASDQPVSALAAETDRAGDDLPADISSTPEAAAADTISTPSSLAPVESCPVSDYVAPPEGIVPMEEEEDPFGANTAEHSGIQRPTSLPMHTGVHVGSAPPVVMTAAPYGPTTYLDGCAGFGIAQGPPNSSLPPTCGGGAGGGGNSEHYVMVHINAGETFSVRMGDQLQHITGPATVRMVSNNGPPAPMPMQVPPGHMVQQIVDETGILTHVILSPHPAPTPGGPPAGPPPPQAGPPTGPPSAAPVSGAQTPAGFYSHPHHHPGSAGSPGLYTQYGGPSYGPANGPSNSSGPPPGCPSPHRAHHHHYYGQQGGQGGYIHSQSAVASSSSGGMNNGSQPMSHCNGPASGNHETRGERSKARLQARINKRQQQQHHQQQQASSASTYGPHHHHSHNSHHHNYHNYHHDRRQYVGGPSQMSSHHNNVSAGGSRVNGDLSPHRVAGSHYPEDGGSLSGGEEVPLVSSGGEGGHFHPGAAHHHASHSIHHSHHRHHQTSLAPPPPASQQPCSLTEDERKYVQMLLSSMPLPKVSDVEGRRALIQIVPPDPATFSPGSTSSGEVVESEEKKGEGGDEEEACCTVPPDLDPYDFVFELHLSEKGAEGKYDLVFRGEATEISLRDLKPACEYHVKIRCLYEHVKGDMTRPVRFMTDSAEPNAPRPPLISSKTKNSISLRWAPNGDNGAKITNFLLYWDSGNEALVPTDFLELYSGPQRLYKVTKLNASSNYRFRLAAANSRGSSEFSDVVIYSTSGTAPSIPDPPTLAKQHVKALTIAWVRRSTDALFTLHMEDKSTSHGFLPVYHGPELSYTITNLRRNTEYQFRLAANNEEGASKWSPTVSYRTLPDRPHPPSRLQTKGKVRPDHFKVTWESPDDDGGSAVQVFAIEIAQDSSEGLHSSAWSRVYDGPDLECLCSSLRPGRLVRVRGLSQSAGGWSEPSPILTVQLPPVVPSTCPMPQLQGKPKANSLLLMWSQPYDDGGATILNYEVRQEPCLRKDIREEDKEEMEEEEEVLDPEDSRMVYTGGAANCTVAGLKPGRRYLFQVRASNKAGSGPWSAPLQVTSGPGVPEEPKPPVVFCRGPHAAVISWQAPASNGADITEYRLEWQSRPDADFTTLYLGDALSYEVKSLLPVTTYSFRVLAHNAAGSSAVSSSTSVLTPPGSPGQIGTLRATSVTAHSVTLVWQRPSDNGSEITSYNIDLGEKQIVSLLADKACSNCSTQLEYTVEGLPPETTFRLRVQAVNAIGIGTFSVPIKVTTLTLPPTAPQRIELVQAQANSLKVRWGEGVVSSSGSGDLTQYTLEFSRQPDSGWQVVYVGPGHTYKVARLAETTDYYFRVIASNEAGQGDPSPTHCFSTTKALPPAVRAPRITDLTPDSCRVEWSPLRPMGQDRLLYILQLLCVNGKNADYRQLSRNYKEVYRGTDTSCRLTCLNEGTEYLVRVAAIRQCLVVPPPAAAAVRVDCRAAAEEEGSAGSGHLLGGDTLSAGGATSPAAGQTLLAAGGFSGDFSAALSGESVLGTASSASIDGGALSLASGGGQPVYEELMGPFSQGVAFTTRGPARHRAGSAGGGALAGQGDADGEVSGAASFLASLLSFRSVGPLSDHHWAILILLVFACLTCLIAFLLQHLLFANENGTDSL